MPSIIQVRQNVLHRGATAAAAVVPIAFVNGTSTASTNNTSVTSGTIDTTGANFLVVAVADFNASGTVTDSKSNSWTARTAVGSNPSIRVWYSVPTSVGTLHTVSYTGSSPSIGFAAFSNVNAIPFDLDVGATGNSTSASSGSITPSATGALIISAVAAISFTPITVDSSFNIIGTALPLSANNDGFGMAYFIETTIAAKNPTWTLATGNPWSATNAAFKN